MDKLTLALILGFILFFNYISSIFTGYGFGLVTYTKQTEAGIGIGIVINQSQFSGVPIYKMEFTVQRVPRKGG